jgi:DNA-binding NtrC family response regulator
MEKKRLKVLVVDDEKIVRDFFSRLLSFQGLDVMVAEDGYKAIELAKAGAFDLFFLDVRMPKIDGLETYRQIRQINPNASVVMMTGYAVEEILKQAEKEGVYGAIRKPFNISEIKEIIDKVSIVKTKEFLNVLVVDDDSSIRNAIAAFLNSQSQRCSTASNREEALAYVRKTKFDLVFLDLVLKESDGIQLYREIKDILPDSFVVLVTGYPEKAKIMQETLKIEGCLYKPFEIDKILDYLEKVKQKKKGDGSV